MTPRNGERCGIPGAHLSESVFEFQQPEIRCQRGYLNVRGNSSRVKRWPYQSDRPFDARHQYHTFRHRAISL
jgi:hypothetical protein